MTTVSVPLNDLCECGSSSWIARAIAATNSTEEVRCAVCGRPAPEPPTPSGEPGASTLEPVAHREEADAVNNPQPPAEAPKPTRAARAPKGGKATA